jgi:hypothetical protein
LPYHFTECLNIPSIATKFPTHANRLASRHGEPPDPPPQKS